MKVEVRIQHPRLKFEGMFTGETADAVVAQMQSAVAARAGLIAGLAIRTLTPLAFARETVRRWAEAEQRDVVLPASCEEFLELGVAEKIARVVEP